MRYCTKCRGNGFVTMRGTGLEKSVFSGQVIMINKDRNVKCLHCGGLGHVEEKKESPIITNEVKIKSKDKIISNKDNVTAN